jgi:hypothetical protein
MDVVLRVLVMAAGLVIVGATLGSAIKTVILPRASHPRSRAGSSLRCVGSTW